MNIAVDCRMLRMSGIGTYLRNILINLISENNDDIFFLIGDGNELKSFFVGCNNIRIIECTIPIFSVKELFHYPVRFINKNCDIFYSPNYNIPLGLTIPIFSTIHDVLFLDLKLVSGIRLLIRYLYLLRCVCISSHIFTVSNFSKERILAHFSQIKSSKISIVYNAVDSSLISYMENSRDELPLYSFKYFLYVGNIKEHKGVSYLIDAFNIYRENHPDFKLVIVGEYSNFKTLDIDILADLNSDEDVVFTGKVADVKLYNIIKYSYCLIQPSLYEGFGLPPLEALYLSVPVILSDISVFKELYSNFPVTFFKCKDSIDLADKMTYIANHRSVCSCVSKSINDSFSYLKSSSIIYNSIKNG